MSNEKLYHGDCLDILCQLDAQAAGEPFIDLIYIDPPFNSGVRYSAGGDVAFSDQWGRKDLHKELEKMTVMVDPKLLEFLAWGRRLFTPSQVAYLTSMSHRLWYMHRLLKPTGSLYLHCDSAMSHYLKVALDIIFGVQNFQNEIIWQRTSAHSDPTRYGRISDSILFYSKDTTQLRFYIQHMPYSQKYLDRFYRYKDAKGCYRLSDLTGPKVNPNDTPWRGYFPAHRGRSWSLPKKSLQCLVGDAGMQELTTTQKLDLLYEHQLIHISGQGVPSFKRYLEDMAGVTLQNIWTDIGPIGANAKEKLGYPTQKPEALLERIMVASSEEGDLVADFFCGSGTTLAVAKRLGRRWLGCDSNAEAVELAQKRLGN